MGGKFTVHQQFITVVGVYINIIKTTFYLDLDFNLAFKQQTNA